MVKHVALLIEEQLAVFSLTLQYVKIIVFHVQYRFCDIRLVIPSLGISRNTL